jgi:hypothetical protein
MPGNEIENCSDQIGRQIRIGDDDMNGKAVLENVRRYRAIASLYRQTAAFRPLQRTSLLGQAHDWEHLAMEALETYFAARNGAHQVRESSEGFDFRTQWETVAAAA